MTKAPGMHVWRGVCLRKEGGGVGSSVLACLYFISAAETAELPSGAQIPE